MSEIIRFLVFSSIGVFNTVLDIGSWNLLYRLFNRRNVKINIGFIKISNYLIAHTFSFGISAISSYILNSVFTFSDSTGNKFDLNKFYSFFGVTLFTFGITSMVLYFLTEKNFSLRANLFLGQIEKIIGIKEGFISRKWPTIAKITTVIISTFTNYLGYKFLVF